MPRRCRSWRANRSWRVRVAPAPSDHGSVPSRVSGCRSRGCGGDRTAGSVMARCYRETVRTTPDMSLVARRAAVGERFERPRRDRSRHRQAAHRGDRTGAGSVVSGMRPRRPSERSSSRGSSCGTMPTAWSNSFTKPGTREPLAQGHEFAVARMRRRGFGRFGDLGFKDGDDRVTLADLALGDDPAEPLPVVADGEIGSAGRPAAADPPGFCDASGRSPTTRPRRGPGWRRGATSRALRGPRVRSAAPGGP